MLLMFYVTGLVLEFSQDDKDTTRVDSGPASRNSIFNLTNGGIVFSDWFWDFKS